MGSVHLSTQVILEYVGCATHPRQTTSCSFWLYLFGTLRPSQLAWDDPFRFGTVPQYQSPWCRGRHRWSSLALLISQTLGAEAPMDWTEDKKSVCLKETMGLTSCSHHAGQGRESSGIIQHARTLLGPMQHVGGPLSEPSKPAVIYPNPIHQRKAKTNQPDLRASQGQRLLRSLLTVGHLLSIGSFLDTGSTASRLYQPRPGETWVLPAV